MVKGFALILYVHQEWVENEKIVLVDAVIINKMHHK